MFWLEQSKNWLGLLGIEGDDPMILSNVRNCLPSDSITIQKTGIISNTGARIRTVTPVLTFLLSDEYLHTTPITCVLFGYTFLIKKQSIMVVLTASIGKVLQFSTLLVFVFEFVN
jgi:hypothetical protein